MCQVDGSKASECSEISFAYYSPGLSGESYSYNPGSCIDETKFHRGFYRRMIQNERIERDRVQEDARQRYMSTWIQQTAEYLSRKENIITGELFRKERIQGKRIADIRERSVHIENASTRSGCKGPHRYFYSSASRAISDDPGAAGPSRSRNPIICDDSLDMQGVYSLGFAMSLKGRLLTALVYDMAFVKRLGDEIHSLLVQFDVRHRHHQVTVPRGVIVAFYYFLCRVTHPSSRTLGEELTGLGPSGKARFSTAFRAKRFVVSLISLSPHFILLPMLRSRLPNKWFTVIESLNFLVTDLWFLMSPAPLALTLYEDRLARASPSLQLTTVGNPTDNLHVPKYVYMLVGAVSLLKTMKHCMRVLSVSSGKSVCASKTAKEVCMNRAINNEQYPIQCSICLDSVSVPTALVCGHILCWSCAVEWTTQNADGADCPTCRTKCSPEQLVPLVHYMPAVSDGSGSAISCARTWIPPIKVK